MHPELVGMLDVLPRDNLTFLVTGQGKPFTPAGFGNWFSKAIRGASLPKGCSSHGLRKAAARRLAEAGCSEKEIAAMTGHQTLKEVARYTRAADQRRLADQAMTQVERAQREQKLANLQQGLAKVRSQPIETKGLKDEDGGWGVRRLDVLYRTLVFTDDCITH